MGLGSGLLVKMGVERVLTRNGYDQREFSVDVGDISTARQVGIDLYVTTEEFSKQIGDIGVPVVEVFNLFDEKEIEQHLIEPYKQVREKKGLE
jgi:galactitol-specific phosphotransferase system IIB component